MGLIYNTYYFNGSVGITDTAAVWTNDLNAADGDETTYASKTGDNSNNLDIEGTNAPGSGATIERVSYRFLSQAGGAGGAIRIDIYDGATFLINNSSSLTTINWTTIKAVPAPAAGWSWAKVQGLKANCQYNNTNEGRVYRVELLVFLVDTPTTIGNYGRHLQVGNGMSRNEGAT